MKIAIQALATFAIVAATIGSAAATTTGTYYSPTGGHIIAYETQSQGYTNLHSPGGNILYRYK